VKNSTFVYINLSLFYNSDSWNFLVREGITRFFESVGSTSTYDAKFVLMFSFERGDNIRITTKIKGKLVDRFLFDFDFFFQEFMIRNPSEKKSVHVHLQSVFLEFPVNSVRYNLYEYVVKYRKADLHAIFSHMHAVTNIIVEQAKQTTGKISSRSFRFGIAAGYLRA